MALRRLALALVAAAALAGAPARAQLSAAPASDELSHSDEAFAKAVTLHQAGDVIGAIDWYQRALKISPWRLDARSNLGAAYAKLGRFDDAVAQYKSALETDPGQVGIRFNLGLALYKTGSLDDAAAEFREVLKRDASQRPALLLLADCTLQMGDDAGVVALLQPREGELLDDHLFAYLLGTALIQTNDLEHGQAVIDRLFRDGESAEGHLLIGIQHMRRVDSREAVTHLSKAAELNPELPTVHSLLGVALMNNGDRPAAMASFRRELKTNPNDFQANLRLGLLLRDEDKLDEARDYLQRAARLRPKDPDVLYGFARIQLGRDELAAAQKTLEELTASAPEFEGGHVLLATVYYRVGRREDGDRERAIVEKLKAAREAKGLAGDAPPKAQP